MRTWSQGKIVRLILLSPYFILAFLVGIGQLVAFLAPIRGWLASSLVAIGLFFAVLGLQLPFVAAPVERTLHRTLIGVCCWVTGWLLWPLWVNGIHLVEPTYSALAAVHASRLPPGAWFEGAAWALWLMGAMVGTLFVLVWTCAYAFSSTVH